jgi:hypothetical protein
MTGEGTKEECTTQCTEKRLARELAQICLHLKLLSNIFADMLDLCGSAYRETA